MDRICLSIAILPMSQEFGWHPSMQGIVQSAFLYGYMATQLLGGALADKYGGKIVMAAGIAWFSVASLLLPAAISAPVVAAGLTVPAILLARCLVGLGEGVALPTMSNMIAKYVPKEAKGRALGLAFSGFHSGNLLGLLLSPLILMNFGWRALFYTFGLCGVPLLLLWMAVVPGKEVPGILQQQEASLGTASTAPPASPAAAAAAAGEEGGVSEKQEGSRDVSGSSGADVTIGQLLSSRATWAIILVNIVNHWGYFIYLNWMPTYFNQALGFDLRSSSFLAFLPWLVMACGSSASGLLADTLVARGVPVTNVRKALQTVAFLIPAIALQVLSQPGITPTAAVACMTVALGTTSLGQAGFVANMSDIAPNAAGKMFGLCNTFGSLSGILGVTAVGFIVEATKSFAPVFQLTSALYVLGTIAWLCMCTGERVF
ncbi:MAG: hypothetical protein WDW36_004828 [Sanguina aurantia]